MRSLSELKMSVCLLLSVLFFLTGCEKADFLYKLSDVEADSLFLLAKEANVKGNSYTEAFRKDSAIVFFKEAVDIIERINRRRHLPDLYINLADCYGRNGDYSLSGFYYRKALFLSDSLGLEENYYPIYSGMGRLYVDLENFKLADEYLKKAENYISNVTDYEKYYFANTRGNYYYNTKDYDKALEWFRRAYLSANASESPSSKAVVEVNMGEIFLLTNRLDSAQYYLNCSKKSWGDLYNQPSVKFYIDGMFASLALQKNEIGKAEKLLLQEFDFNDISPLVHNYHNRRMQQFYELKNDYQSAYQYKIKISAYDDSLRNMKVQNNITEMAFRYQQDTTVFRKDLQIAETELKVSQWKNTSFVIIFLFISILLAIGIFYLYKKRSSELKYSRQLATISNLRMEITRNRISPHFTFNVLNAIMPAIGEYKMLEQPFRLLVHMLRSNLRASEKISVSLDEEIRLVKNYLQLYQLSHPERMHVNWEVADNVPTDFPIPSMSIQIPVENAVKYAFSDEIGSPLINIIIFVENEDVRIIVEDNGIGFRLDEKLQDEKGTGYGLRMLYNTVELLNSRNSRKMVFKIQDNNKTTNNGTKVLITIPFDYIFDI